MPQSLSNVLVHLIFSTKLRYPYIDKRIIKELHHYMVGIVRTYDVFVHEIGDIEDHVHILISLPQEKACYKSILGIRHNQLSQHIL